MIDDLLGNQRRAYLSLLLRLIDHNPPRADTDLFDRVERALEALDSDDDDEIVQDEPGDQGVIA
jgi:hypothetical protein